MAAALSVCTKEEQGAVIGFFVGLNCIGQISVHLWLSAQCGNNVLLH
jgi:hypothetical protein